jgi:hypothetical protein
MLALATGEYTPVMETVHDKSSAQTKTTARSSQSRQAQSQGASASVTVSLWLQCALRCRNLQIDWGELGNS